MKKIVVVAMILTGFFFLSAKEENDQPCKHKSFSITLSAGARNFSESLFKEVYESSPMIYSIDIAKKFMPSLEVFLHSDYLSKDGKYTFTGDSTTLKILPIEIGARFLVQMKNPCKQKVFPYAGAGVGYYMIEEKYSDTSPVEDVKENRVGFFAEGGLKFYFAKSIFVDAKLKYIALKSEGGTQLGGLAYMGGLGFSF